MKSKRKSESFARLLYGMTAGLLIGIAALAIYLVQVQLRGPKADDTGQFSDDGKYTFDGAIRIEPPIDLAEFTLSNQDGLPFKLSDLRGRHVLLTFGFTNCPDICPLTLSDFQQVGDMLGDRADEVAFVFISVDGRRDTPAVMRSYFDYRQLHGIIALTGSEETVRGIGAPLGLSFEVSGDASADAYTVNHTVGSFLLDASGRWIMRYQFGLPPDRIAAELRTLLM